MARGWTVELEGGPFDGLGSPIGADLPQAVIYAFRCPRDNCDGHLTFIPEKAPLKESTVYKERRDDRDEEKLIAFYGVGDPVGPDDEGALGVELEFAGGMH
jgi:hypothetical protein